MWEHRNSILYSPHSFHYKREQRLLNSHIKQEYNKGAQYLSREDKKLLERPLHKTLQLSNDDKQLWLDSVYWAREQHTAPEARDHQELQRQRGAMKNWLQTGSF